MPIIRELTPKHINILPQGPIVAESLLDYLNRHPEMESRCVKNTHIEFYTTDDVENFNQHATAFYGQAIHSKHLEIKSL
jgi:glutamate racemase